MALATAAIDHIIILLPHADIVTPPKWLSDKFNISQGGCHADGKTENKLILLSDGSYIELIAFVDDSQDHRSGHWWDVEYGIVDYAMTDDSGHFDNTINQRLTTAKSAISYDKPRRGGRTRPDGVQMEWEVTFPAGVKRGTAPFWCHDITPRHRRVPLTTAATTHPCGATGIRSVKILLPDRDRNEVNTALAAIIETPVNAEQTYTIAAPCPLLTPPNLKIEKAAAEHTIELVLQVARSSTATGIEQQVGDGSVKIMFEREQ